MTRQPGAEALRQVGKAAGLSHAKEKARNQEGRVTPRPSRGRCEERPPEHNPQQDLARPDPVTQPAARNLKRRVRQTEGGKHIAHLNRRKAQLGRDRPCRLAHRSAIDIHNEREREAQGDHPISLACGRLFLCRPGHYHVVARIRPLSGAPIIPPALARASHRRAAALRLGLPSA